MLTWKNIFHSKVPGRNIYEVAKVALDNCYAYFSFNDRIYWVRYEDNTVIWGEVTLTVRDIE